MVQTHMFSPGGIMSATSCHSFPRRPYRVGFAVICVASLSFHLASAQQPAAATSPSQADWAAVNQAFGRKGVPQPGDVMRYNFPRADLQVTTHGVQLKPGFALGSWVALKRTAPNRAMAMGDLVLLEDEVGPVMRALQQGGVRQTALHNHIQGESPHVMYMHISADDDPVKIAQAVHTALGQSKTPMEPPAPAASAAIELDTAAVAGALGRAGRVNGGVYQVSVPRRESIREGMFEVPPSMGVATAINFQPTGGGKAAITGDFVLIASEVNPVIQALTGNGIEVTALHSHLLEESPISCSCISGRMMMR